MNYTYILQCADGSLYTGWTNNMSRRLENHRGGHGAKYTRSRLPVRLVYCEQHRDKVSAMQREYYIKHLKRYQKIEMIRKR